MEGDIKKMTTYDVPENIKVLNFNGELIHGLAHLELYNNFLKSGQYMMFFLNVPGLKEENKNDAAPLTLITPLDNGKINEAMYQVRV